MGSDSLKNQKVAGRVNFKMIPPYKDHREDREAVEVAKAERERLQLQAVRAGSQLARALFEKRGSHSEAHVSEPELAAMLALAFEQGAKSTQK